MQVQARSILAKLGLIACFAAASALAQTSPRAYEAAPEVYKVVAEGPQHRVLAVTLKPGQRTAPHSHPAATAIYFISDCELKITEFGVEFTTRPAAGTAMFMGIVVGHSAFNSGQSECRMVYFEPK